MLRNKKARVAKKQETGVAKEQESTSWKETRN